MKVNLECSSCNGTGLSEDDDGWGLNAMTRAAVNGNLYSGEKRVVIENPEYLAYICTSCRGKGFKETVLKVRDTRKPPDCQYTHIYESWSDAYDRTGTVMTLEEFQRS